MTGVVLAWSKLHRIELSGCGVARRGVFRAVAGDKLFEQVGPLATAPGPWSEGGAVKINPANASTIIAARPIIASVIGNPGSGASGGGAAGGPLGPDHPAPEARPLGLELDL